MHQQAAMALSIQLPHLILLLLPLFPLSFSSNPLIHHYCGTNTSTTSPNPLQSNINIVLSDLIIKTPPSGFAISSHGNGTAALYGLTRCRGDIPADVCSTCIAEAAKQLPSLCPNVTDARIWYDYCFLRYDAKNFIGKVDTSNGLVLYNAESEKDSVRFERAVKGLMGGVEEAAVGSERRYGWGERGFVKTVSVRGMEQCTRDLSGEGCRECLDSALGLFPEYCGYHRGCQVVYSSCVVRYEIYDFRYEGGGRGYGNGGLGLRKIAV